MRKSNTVRDHEPNDDEGNDSNNEHDGRTEGTPSSSSFGHDDPRIEQDPAATFDYEDEDEDESSELSGSAEEDAERKHWIQTESFLAAVESKEFQKNFAKFLHLRKHPPNPGSPDARKDETITSLVYVWCVYKADQVAAKIGPAYHDDGIKLEAVNQLLDWMADNRKDDVPCKPLFLKYIRPRLLTAKTKVIGRTKGPYLEEPVDESPTPDTAGMVEDIQKHLDRLASKAGVDSPIGTWIAGRLSDSASIVLWEAYEHSLKECFLSRMVGVGIDWLTLRRWLKATYEPVMDIEEAVKLKPTKSSKLTHAMIVAAIERYSVSRGFKPTIIKVNTWSKWVSRAKEEIDRIADDLFPGSGDMGTQPT